MLNACAGRAFVIWSSQKLARRKTTLGTLRPRRASIEIYQQYTTLHQSNYSPNYVLRFLRGSTFLLFFSFFARRILFNRSISVAAGLLSIPSCYRANKIKTDFIIFTVCFASFYVGFSSVRVYRSRGIQICFYRLRRRYFYVWCSISIAE